MNAELLGLLETCQLQGVRLSRDGDRLRLDYKQSVSDELRDRLRTFKPAILEYIDEHGTAEVFPWSLEVLPYGWKRPVYRAWERPKVDPRVILDEKPKCPWSKRQAGLE